MIDEIHILKHRKSGYFCSSPGEKSVGLLGVVSYHHELVVKLGEDSFDSFAKSFVSPCRRFPILLIQPIGNFKGDVCLVEEVLSYLRTEVSFVTEHQAVMMFPLHILEIMEVVNIGCSHIVRVYHAAYPADGVKFISIVVDALGCAITPLWSPLPIIFAHSAAFGPGILADLDRFGVDAENSLFAIHCHRHVLAYFFTKNGRKLTALIVLPASDQVGKAISLFSVEPLEKIIFTVESKRLGCGRECDNFKVGKLGDDAAMWAISILIYTISCEFLVDFENLSELYDEVVHKREIVINGLVTTNLLNISDMCNFFFVIVLEI